MVSRALIRFPVMINLDGGRGPMWRRVLGHLRQRVLAGEFPERLPSEKWLADEYGVSIGTIRKALAAMRADGLIETDKGYGSYVVGDGSS